jgi:hypothetical protein
MQGPNPGPTLVVDVANRSDRDVAVGYEYEAFGTSGLGEALSTACRREALQFEPISGQYKIFVDGDAVTNGMVATLPGEFLVLTLRIHENGGIEVAEPVTRAQAPETNVTIASCEEARASP